MKLKRKVAPNPTGRYGSFDHWGWPTASHEDERIAVALYCDRDYSGALRKATSGLEIKICIADWSVTEGSFKWRTLKQRATNLQEAKDIAKFFLLRHPEFAEVKK